MPSSTTLDRQDLPASERILLTAHDLFYREGIRATGIDRVIAESGVTKVTFYRHFPSKNELILAFLAYRHERWMALVRRGPGAPWRAARQGHRRAGAGAARMVRAMRATAAAPSSTASSELGGALA